MTEDLQQTLHSGADHVIQYRNLKSDGSVHWVDVRARPLRSNSGHVITLVGVSSDITARKNSELERERLLGEPAVERTALSNMTRRSFRLKSKSSWISPKRQVGKSARSAVPRILLFTPLSSSSGLN
jgi:PAS fold